jgi:cell division septation protein DedD
MALIGCYNYSPREPPENVMRNTGICLIVITAAAFALAGCSRESADWKSATTAGTTESYQQFLQQHPNSSSADQARARLKALMEDHDWQSAAAADTRNAYEQFIALHPDSKWAQEARIRIENFAQNGANATGAPATAAAATPATPAPASVTPAPTASKSRAAAATPAPATHQAATKVASATHGHFVQLGAFHSKEQAQTQWKHLAAQFPTELKSLKPDYVEAPSKHGAVYRLRVPMSSVAAAKGLCGTLKKHAQSCVPVTA